MLSVQRSTVEYSTMYIEHYRYRISLSAFAIAYSVFTVHTQYFDMIKSRW